MDALHQLQRTLRSFGRQPGLTAIIVGTLALGVGLNATVFAVAYTVLWRPLPYPESDRLVTIEQTHGGDRSGGVRPDLYRDWSDRLRSADLAGVQQRERRVRGNGPARITATALVSESFFDVLGVGAVRGRAPRLMPGDGRAVVSRRLEGRLAGERDVVGQIVALACGGASAVGALRSQGIELITGTGRAVSPVTRRLRASLVAGQIALAIVLLAGAGLLTRSVGALLAEDGGYDAGRVVTARLMLDDTRFPDDRALVDFVNRLLGEVRALPTVTAAGVGSMLPPADAPISINLWMNRDTGDDRRVLSWGAVTSGFFEALGTSLEDGRRFRVEDERAVIPNAILSVSAARFIFRDDSVIGKSMGWAVERMALTRDTTVLGVVGDMKYRGLAADRDASIYVPWPQRPMGLSHLVVRSSGDPSALIPTLRRLIARLDPTLPLPEVRTLEDHVADSIAGRRLQLVPAVAVAALALVVSMFGLFGALGRAVAERRHELSIRAAVGGSPARLVRLVAVGSLVMTTVGLLAGLASAAVMGRGLASLLYGVSPYDPLTFFGVALLVLGGAVAATLVPARRAARLDPVIALKGVA